MQTKDTINQRVCQLLLSKDYKGVMKLLEQGILRADQSIRDVASGGEFSLLVSAIERGWTEFARYLLTHGADVNRKTYGWTPLMFACQFGNHEIIEMLVATGADVNAQASKGSDGGGETALMEAARKHNIWAVKRLLEAGADAKILTPRKQSAVYFAASPSKASGDVAEVVRTLFSAHCPLLGNELHYPIYRRDVVITKLLLECGTPTNTQFDHNDRHGPQRGETPLTTLADLNAVDLAALGFKDTSIIDRGLEIAKLLLAAGADPNLASARGRTPLTTAVLAKKLPLVELLLKAGADPNVVAPGSTESAASVAKKQGAQEFVHLFERAHQQGTNSSSATTTR